MRSHPEGISPETCVPHGGEGRAGANRDTVKEREQELLCLERPRTAGDRGAQQRGLGPSRELQSHLSEKFRMTGL